MTEWIKCSDRFPPEDEWIILGSYLHEIVTFGMYMDGKFVNPDWDYEKIKYVTHWMPLPNPPQE